MIVIDRVLQSLPPSYKSFMMNYNMQGVDKTIPVLFTMVKAGEVEIKKEHQVLMVNKTTSFKKKGKGKKGNFKKNSKQVAPGYLILVLLLIFATRNRGYGLSEDWLRTR